MLEKNTEIYNKVSSQVLAGTKNTNKAMQEAVSQLAEKGLTSFTAIWWKLYRSKFPYWS